ncbi:hypothetical protein Ciccas_008461 [Cichlidogyrus casuarinus]|uniref:Uncharacterized protein n=1 Tax=Cichlidogyrus casuarinus TaxID=1844966 RepID=A0ABD2Q1D5_9PLAT
MGADPSHIAHPEECPLNALDVAVENYARDAAEAIILSKRWRNALMNRQKLNDAGYQDTPLRKIIRNIPELANIVFDRMIEITNKNLDIDDSNFECTYHVDLIEDTFTDWQLDKKDTEPPPYSKRKLPTESRVNIRMPDCFRSRIKKALEWFYGQDKGTKTKKPYNDDSSVIRKNHILTLIVSAMNCFS